MQQNNFHIIHIYRTETLVSETREINTTDRGYFPSLQLVTHLLLVPLMVVMPLLVATIRRGESSSSNALFTHEKHSKSSICTWDYINKLYESRVDETFERKKIQEHSK